MAEQNAGVRVGPRECREQASIPSPTFSQTLDAAKHTASFARSGAARSTIRLPRKPTFRDRRGLQVSNGPVILQSNVRVGAEPTSERPIGPTSD